MVADVAVAYLVALALLAAPSATREPASAPSTPRVPEPESSAAEEDGPSAPDDPTAEDGLSEEAAAAEPIEQAEEFVPPEPIETPLIPLPENAPPIAEVIDVEVLIRIDTNGEVERVELKRGVGEPFDAAVLTGATLFRFSPATFRGKPVTVEISYTQRFVPPPVEEEPAAAPEETGVLSGLVEERGTNRPIKRAIVVARGADGEERIATSDENGLFDLTLPPGTYTIRIVSEGYRRFKQVEVVESGGRLRVKYLVMRESYSPYEAIVIGKRERTEVSRTTLRDREIRHVPGTFGDPFRVVSTLPGVIDVIGPLLPMSVVRGASPGNTGYLLDGMRVPLLFHLFAGPAVIHPEFFDHLDFYPGGFGVSYGGYIGGIVDGKTRAARPNETRYEADITLTQSGLFLRRDVPWTRMTATAAGRIGYPGWLIRLANPDVSLSYWDYQVRTDARLGSDRLSIFVYGAQDDVKTRPEEETVRGEETWQEENSGSTRDRPLERQLLFRFHRIDVRYRDNNAKSNGLYRVAVGTEAFQLGDVDGMNFQIAPELSWRADVREYLTFRFGVKGAFDRIDATLDAEETEDFILVEGEWLNTAGAHMDLVWRTTEELQIVPGVRADWYHMDDIDEWSIDPRVLARYQLRDAKNERIWLKSAVGWYHQPPRLFISVPVLRTTDLSQGLLAAVHTMLGTEIEVGRDVTVDLQAYFNTMDPVFQELSTSREVSNLIPQDPTIESKEEDVPLSAGRSVGRSYGVEILLRRQAGEHFFAWLAYTLSFSQRRRDGQWVPFDHDRRHIINAVGGFRLPRNWELGLRISLQSGAPVTTIHGYNAGRAEGQMRIDVRMDKRAIWNDWMLDFYVDIINIAVTREAIGFEGESGFRYVLPTVGFRAVL